MKTVPVRVVVKCMTAKAALLILCDNAVSTAVWVPLSQIDESDVEDLTDGLATEVNISEWFYEKEIEDLI